MATDTSEKGLEKIITDYLVCSNGYEEAISSDFNKTYAVDEERVIRFLKSTQPEKVALAHIEDNAYEREKFFAELSRQLSRDGIVAILRKGVRILNQRFDMYYGIPNYQNNQAVALYENNVFSVMRQVHYSANYPKLSLDICVFINGIPVITFELKNNFTKQSTEDAIKQYKTDRDPKELIFNFKRCAVHFAVDDNTIMMCTHLQGQSSWFLPFNKGNNDGAGNPPNPNGLKTDYLWKKILTKASLSNIIENYSQVVIIKDKKTGKVKEEIMIFPRYHQLMAVRELLYDTVHNEIGKRYLIQHSAGSGKSNSMAWLAYQLVKLEKYGKPMFDSIIVITDRVNLDKQIRDTIRQFMQEKSIVGWASSSTSDSSSSTSLKTLLDSGKKIIITTVHKFSFILDSIGTENKNKTFAILIDEAHSSQSGSLSANMNIGLSGNVSDGDEEQEEEEDIINKLLEKHIEGRKMAKNANYYAFTATPKNKTLEMFGIPVRQADGKVEHFPFHTYTMRQAIEEHFIMDVLEHYIPIDSYYKLIKSVEDDPKFDKAKAEKLLRAFVEGDKTTIRSKARIMIEHFHTQVIQKGKLGGKARAMIVTASIRRAIDYFFVVNELLKERNSQYKAIVAFSGAKEYADYKEFGKITESSLNGFPSSEIEDRMEEDPYRILIVANKFQTGYDEPLLHTMYVDKVLTDIKAVQTLSRLNRAYELKRDTFVLDFANDPEDIKAAFQRYYKQTFLTDETDPNKLNDLIAILEQHQVYSNEQVEKVVKLYLSNAPRENIDPILDTCAEVYKELDEDSQVSFKGTAKSFVRTYSFLAAIMPFGSHEWEKLSIFLGLLVHKLPSPKGEDLISGLLEAVDYSSYRNVIQIEQIITLMDENAGITPIPVKGGGDAVQPEVDLLSNILDEFNTRFGNINWTDSDRVKKQIAAIPEELKQNEAYRNAIRNSDKQSARIECDKALYKIIMNSMATGLDLYRVYQDNPSFQHWLQESVFEKTYPNGNNVKL